MSAEGDKRLIEQTQTYHVSSTVAGWHHDEFSNNPSWQDAMRSTAGRSLAEAILKNAGELRILDLRTESDPFGKVEYRWTVRVVMPGELFDYFGKQLSEARAEAKAEIIEKVREELHMAGIRAENREGFRLLMESAIDRLAK